MFHPNFFALIRPDLSENLFKCIKVDIGKQLTWMLELDWVRDGVNFDFWGSEWCILAESELWQNLSCGSLSHTHPQPPWNLAHSIKFIFCKGLLRLCTMLL